MKIYGYGYVNKVDEKEKFTAMKISCYDGKDKDGNAKRYLLSVRVFPTQGGQRISAQPGQMAYLDGAELSIFKYNDAWYTEARINAANVWVKGQPSETQGQGVSADDSSIPF